MELDAGLEPKKECKERDITHAVDVETIPCMLIFYLIRESRFQEDLKRDSNWSGIGGGM